MARLSIKEKQRIAKELSDENRPISRIAHLVKGNEAPGYDSNSLLERSKRTAAKRAKRLSKVAARMARTN